jgi:hypothetical protein
MPDAEDITVRPHIFNFLDTRLMPPESRYWRRHSFPRSARKQALTPCPTAGRYARFHRPSPQDQPSPPSRAPCPAGGGPAAPTRTGECPVQPGMSGLLARDSEHTSRLRHSMSERRTPGPVLVPEAFTMADHAIGSVGTEAANLLAATKLVSRERDIPMRNPPSELPAMRTMP